MRMPYPAFPIWSKWDLVKNMSSAALRSNALKIGTLLIGDIPMEIEITPDDEFFSVFGLGNIDLDRTSRVKSSHKVLQCMIEGARFIDDDLEASQYVMAGHIAELLRQIHTVFLALERSRRMHIKFRQQYSVPNSTDTLDALCEIAARRSGLDPQNLSHIVRELCTNGGKMDGLKINFTMVIHRANSE